MTGIIATPVALDAARAMTARRDTATIVEAARRLQTWAEAQAEAGYSHEAIEGALHRAVRDCVTVEATAVVEAVTARAEAYLGLGGVW